MSAVKITSPSTADVVCSVVTARPTQLPNQGGQAVRSDGVWKVNAASFEAPLHVGQGASGSFLPHRKGEAPADLPGCEPTWQGDVA
jgi:hypothetical protein